MKVFRLSGEGCDDWLVGPPRPPPSLTSLTATKRSGGLQCRWPPSAVRCVSFQAEGPNRQFWIPASAMEGRTSDSNPSRAYGHAVDGEQTWGPHPLDLRIGSIARPTCPETQSRRDGAAILACVLRARAVCRFHGMTATPRRFCGIAYR